MWRGWCVYTQETTINKVFNDNQKCIDIWAVQRKLCEGNCQFFVTWYTTYKDPPK